MGEVQDEDGTPPPAYGELHGRVLGTGLPPPAVELPSRQDMEDSDQENEGDSFEEEEEEEDEEEQE